MAIPALATADKSFICSYNIGSDIDHRKASGVINEITTFTNEYIDGFCWIPVNAGALNDHSWFWDAPEKDVVYVKVGVRCSADGYLHAWLTSSQKVSELILWYTNYNTQHYAVDDKTTLHWCIEKMYEIIFGNTTSFVLANVKFQKYVGAGSTRLYLFGSYSNSWTNPISYTIDHPTNVQKSSVSWYPNNYTTIVGDYIFSILDLPSRKCSIGEVYTTLYDDEITKAFLDDGGSFTDYTDEFNNTGVNDVPLMPVIEELNDAFYFGSSNRFYELKLNIGTAGAGGANLIDWEYYGGSGWTQFFPTDPTNEFTTSGTNTVVSNMNEDDMNDWVKTTINSSEQYWIRARSNGTGYTTQPILTQGWIRIPDYWVNFGAKPFKYDPADPPLFYKKMDDQSGSTSIASLCNPTDPALKTFSYCHVIGTSSIATGNNSARTYNLTDPGSGTNCDAFSVCPTLISEKYLSLNQENNRAYIEDPPGVYSCDPAFTYDTLVSFTVSDWQSDTPDSIDYVQTEAYFPDSLKGQKFLSKYHEVDTSDTFLEITGDLDKLKHFGFTITDVGSQTNKYRTIYTKHVAVGLLVDAAPTLNTKDWIVNWSGADYFSSWSAPDGLGSRTPGTPNTPYTRPITRHDEFNVVSGEPCLGGFLYDLVTSNAFLSRDPGTETKITWSVSRLTDFDFLYDLLTSNAFLERDPGTETKITCPVNHQSDFEFLYDLVTSNAFFERDPGTETKIGYPVGNNADFCFLYKFVQPPFSVLYHLKLTGDDLDDGLSWSTAWATWTHAMQTTPSERTLLVEEGNYAGEVQVEPDNSIVIFLVKNELDAVSTVTVTLV